jgi:NitT/TauT family transport system substrate-binding protein
MNRTAGWSRRRVLGAALTTALVALAPQALAADKLRIGAPPFYSSLLAYIADELGYWKQAGLEVDLRQFGGGSLVNEAVLGGSIDLGMGVGTGPAVALAARGARVLIVMPEAYADTTSPPELLVVAGNSPITDVKQLNGKSVAVHAKGTLSHILLEALSQPVGIKPVVLEIPVGSQWAALKRGDVAAVMTETPFPEQMKAEGGRYIFGVPHKDVVPYLSGTVSVTTQKFAAENPQVLRKAVAVSLRTARWIMANPEKTRDMIAARYKYKPEVTKLIHPQSFKWGRNATFPMDSIQWWGREMKKLGLIQNEPDYAKYFVTTFVNDALKDVGKVPDADFDQLIKQPISRK